MKQVKDLIAEYEANGELNQHDMIELFALALAQEFRQRNLKPIFETDSLPAILRQQAT